MFLIDIVLNDLNWINNAPNNLLLLWPILPPSLKKMALIFYQNIFILLIKRYKINSFNILTERVTFFFLNKITIISWFFLCGGGALLAPLGNLCYMQINFMDWDKSKDLFQTFLDFLFSFTTDQRDKEKEWKKIKERERKKVGRVKWDKEKERKREKKGWKSKMR